jgi:YhcH/YjgK/YiaL family protein
MLFASLSNRTQWQPFIHSPVLLRSLQWISESAGTEAEGIHELGEPGWYVNVHGYTTQARELCSWENHPETIDIQYMIEGIEAIDLTAVEALGEPTVFKPESDTQKFAAAAGPAMQLILRAGDFVIFLPGEAHRPKVAVHEPAGLRKLVVKIPVRMLGNT